MILIRNVAIGIREVPREVVDAARGMGMSRVEVLTRVELPLALPVIVAGLRIATVTVISVTVVAAYVNAGGLGTLIFNGISNDYAPKIWTGALTACALAVAADLGLAAPRGFRAAAGELNGNPSATGTRPCSLKRGRICSRTRGSSAMRCGRMSRCPRPRSASPIAIAVPLGIWLADTRRAALVAVNAANIGRTLPSLAVLALMMPMLGTGFAPALFALTLLALPPILINTCTAIRQVDADVVDAARGMGMTKLRARPPDQAADGAAGASSPACAPRPSR